MASSDSAFRLKWAWMEMPEEFFEMLTFGELEVGEQFISLPVPGDNSGHGGFRGAHRIFTKIRQSRILTEMGLPYASPHGVAVGNRDRILSDFPHSMPVVRLI